MSTVGPLVGWVVRSGGEWWGSSVSGVEGGGPGVLPGPLFGEVPGDGVASAAGGPGGEVDELGAEGGAAGVGVSGGGQGAQGTGQRVRGDGELEPRGVGVERCRGLVGQRALDEVGEDLFDDGVPAVVGFGLGELEGLSVNTAW
jgi:hypothetical protein